MDAKSTPARPDFSALTMDAPRFTEFYRALMQLRFPLPVAQVLDLRFVINQAVDAYREPPLTADHRQFREALLKAIDSFHIENRHHRRRLLKTLALIRELHVTHSLASRDEEVLTRDRMSANREARARAERFGWIWLAFGAGLGAVWATSTAPEVWLKLATLACTVLSLRAWRQRPRLDSEYEIQRRALNDLLRVRISALNWKTLIHKLSLVLGYKQVRGIEVFRPDTDGPVPSRSRRH